MISSFTLCIGSFVFLLWGYTGYSKTTQSISFPLLVDVLLLRKGVLHSAVELNKVISLVAILMLGVSQSRTLVHLMSDGASSLLQYSLCLVVVHSIFSAVYFGSQRSIQSDLAMATSAVDTLVRGNTRKRMDLLRAGSIILGVASSALLVAAFNSVLLWVLFMLLAAWLALAHFWSMEVDYKLQLQVRPAACIVFVGFVVALLEQVLARVST